jgi:hypothetical protein
MADRGHAGAARRRTLHAAAPRLAMADLGWIARPRGLIAAMGLR